jgi:aryl-alcohol dehydrogenase-like predicted oxidoreductase
MATMRYGTIPGIDKPVSRLAQGTVMVRSNDLDYSFALLDAVFEGGCNLFDTAHGYGGGDNERTVGRWVNQRGLRDKVVMIGKGAHHNQDRRRVTPFDITSDLHDSLARFRFDYIDLYILHRDDPSVPVGPIVEILNEHVRGGLIHAFGGSNWTHERIRQANEYAEAHGLIGFAASSPHFSLARQVQEPWPECVSISGAGNEPARAWYARTRLPLIPWSSLAAGFFSGRVRRDNVDALADGPMRLCVSCYASDDNFERLDRAAALARRKGLTVAQVAVSYVMSQPMNLFPLFGCRTREEFEENAQAMDVRLTGEEIAWLELTDGQ